MFASDELNEYHKMATSLSRRYATKTCRGDIQEDLYQVAWLTILEARERVDLSKGTPERYVWQAIVRAIFDYLKRNVWVSDRQSATLGKSRTRPLQTDMVIEELPVTQSNWPEYRVNQKQWVEKTVILLKDRLGDALEAELAYDVILAGEEPRSVAEAHGVETMRVYRVVEKAKLKLRQSYLMKSLLNR